MMLLGMKKRSRKEGWIVPEFTVEDIAAVLDGGRCAQTGIQFDLERTEHSHNNPFAPSPDRIDSSRGYTKDNVQFVCWMYNAMKSDFPQSAVTQFIGALVNKYTPAYNPPLAQDTFRGLLGKPWGPHSFRWRHTMFIDGMELLVEWSCRRDCYVTQFSEGHAVYWQYVGETYPTDSEIVVAAGYAKPELTLINNRLKRDTQ